MVKPWTSCLIRSWHLHYSNQTCQRIIAQRSIYGAWKDNHWDYFDIILCLKSEVNTTLEVLKSICDVGDMIPNFRRCKEKSGLYLSEAWNRVCVLLTACLVKHSQRQKYWQWAVCITLCLTKCSAKSSYQSHHFCTECNFNNDLDLLTAGLQRVIKSPVR